MLNKEREFSLLVKENESILKKLSLKYEKNSVDAEDLLQDSLIKAFKNFHNYIPTFKFSSWVGVIIKNTYIDKYRKKKGVVINDIDSEDSDSYNLIKGNDHESSLVKIHYDEMVAHANRILDDKLKAPFDLWVQNYKDNEIAEKLNIPKGTVKSRVFAAKQKIAETFPFYFGKVNKNR